MKRKFEGLQHLTAILRNNPIVQGLVRYGGRTVDDEGPGGDFDLFVIVEKRPAQVESLHFYVRSIPVDLNIRTLQDLQRAWPLTEMDFALLDGELLYDKERRVKPLLQEAARAWSPVLGSLSPHERNFERFSKTHVLDKVRHRLHSEPTMCHYLMHSNVHWLLTSYFQIRGRLFPGDGPALRVWQRQEPEMYALLQTFYESPGLTEQLRCMETLTDMVLEPIGGLWKTDEVLAFGLHGDLDRLDQEGEAAWEALFGDVV